MWNINFIFGSIFTIPNTRDIIKTYLFYGSLDVHLYTYHQNNTHIGVLQLIT